MTTVSNAFDVCRIRIVGPLEPYLVGFGTELQRLGYADCSAKIQLELVAYLSRWMATNGVAVSALTPETVQSFLVARRAAGYTYMRSTKALAPLLGYLRGLSVVPAPSAPEPSQDPA